MKVSEIQVVAEEQLDEIAMSPTSLRALAGKIDARAGMEFEMYVPGAEGDSDDYDQEPDMDYNESAYSIQQIADFFYDSDYNGRREVDNFRQRMEEAWLEWRDSKISESWDEDGFDFYVTWVANNIDEETIKEFLGKADDEDYTPGKNDILDYANKLWGEDDNSKHDAYEEFRDEHESDNDYDEETWLGDEGITDMEDAMNSFGRGSISWPHWNDHRSGGSISIDDIASEFAQAVGKRTKAGGSYHSIKGSGRPDATNQFYIVETDGSLDSADSDEDSGLEFVSPAMPVAELFDDLDKIREWTNRMGCYTNASTGLHMNVSVPGWTASDAGKGGTLDYVKLLLLMGDQYVLDQFDRASVHYCESGLEKVQNRIRQEPGLAQGLLDKMKEHLNELASKSLDVMSTNKYTSANIKDGYIEFRSPGGDWLSDLNKNKDKIENTMLRFVVALDAATDPEKYRQEYLKKLYKMLAPAGEQSTIEYFAKYVAGKLPKAALRSFVKQAQLQRKMKREGEQFWWRVDFGNKSTEVIAGTEQEALALAAKEWSTTPESIRDAEITNIGSHAQNPKSVRTQPARTGVNYNNAPVRATTSPETRPAEPDTQRPAAGGNFTGYWKIIDSDGRELYRFNGVGNVQADANRVARDWITQHPQYANQGLNVVPDMTESIENNMNNQQINEGMGSVNVTTEYDLSRIQVLSGLANSSTIAGQPVTEHDLSQNVEEDEELITRLPVDNDEYDRVEPSNRIDGEEFHQADEIDKEQIERLRKLAGLTLGTGNEKGDMDSPLTHGGSERGKYQKAHDIEPGTEDWFKLWFARPKLTGENPYGDNSN